MIHHAVKTSKQTNKRTDNRLNICLKVEVTYGDGRQATFCTRNMSATGLFLDKGNNELPDTGSIIQIRIAAEQGMQDAPLVEAKVTRRTEDGIGIMFLTA